MAIGSIKGLRLIFDFEKRAQAFVWARFPCLFTTFYGQQGIPMPQHAPSAQQAAIKALGVAANAVVAVRERPMTAIFVIRTIKILQLS